MKSNKIYCIVQNELLIDVILNLKNNDNDLCRGGSMANLSHIPYICKHANDESGHLCFIMNGFNSTVT